MVYLVLYHLRCTVCVIILKKEEKRQFPIDKTADRENDIYLKITTSKLSWVILLW